MKRTIPPDPDLNECRQRRVFLWLPKTLYKPGIGQQWRWLEFATITEQWRDDSAGRVTVGAIMFLCPEWKELEWAD